MSITAKRIATGGLFWLAIGLAGCKGCKHEYPPSMVTGFMTTCLAKSNGNERYCSCAMDRFQRKYTVEEFTRMNVKIMLNDRPPEEMAAIIADCLAETTK
jgi:hypothetical protein